MNLLLILDNLSPNCGANVGIAFELMTKWKEAGHSIYCLAREDKYHELDANKAAVLDKVWTFRVKEDDILNDFSRASKWINASSMQKAKLLATHPIVFSKMLDKKYFESSEIQREYLKQINELCKTHKFDAAIAVTEPFYIADALAKADVNCTKYTIMMDPYTNNPSTTKCNRDKKLRKELNVFATNKNVFTLDFVGNDMDYLPNEYQEKVVKFGIPKISIISQKDDLKLSPQEKAITMPDKQSASANQAKDASINAKHDTINFIYVGQLYEDIRNPELMLKMFCELPDNYVLHLYGGGADRIVNQYKDLLKNRLVCHGWVSADEAKEATNNADILINLNNKIKNMLPSKLVDYIDTGKPILNICQIKECPSLEYTKKYPMAVDVLPTDDLETIKGKVRVFSGRYAGKLIKHDIIEKLFIEYTSDYVSNMLLSSILND